MNTSDGSDDSSITSFTEYTFNFWCAGKSLEAGTVLVTIHPPTVTVTYGFAGPYFKEVDASDGEEVVQRFAEETEAKKQSKSRRTKQAAQEKTKQAAKKLGILYVPKLL